MTGKKRRVNNKKIKQDYNNTEAKFAIVKILPPMLFNKIRRKDERNGYQKIRYESATFEV